MNQSLFLVFPLQSKVESGRCWFIDQKLKKLLHKAAISLKSGRFEENYRSFLANWPDRALRSQHFRRFLHICLFICSFQSLPPFHVALWSAFGLLRLPSFYHFASLYLMDLCLLQSNTHLQNAFSLHAGVTKRSDQSRSSQGHIAQCGCHEILIQRCIIVFFLSIFVDLPSSASESSPFLCSKVDYRSFWSVVVLNERISQTRRSHWRIEESKRIIILPLPTELRERPVLLIHSDSCIHVYLGWFFLLWFHCALMSAFGLRRKFLHSLTITLYLHLTLSKIQHQKAFSLNAGAAEGVDQSPQLTGVYGMMRVPRNLDLAFFQRLVLDSYLSPCSTFSPERAAAQI